MRTVDTSTKFAGINLKNPIIVESSDLTNSILKIQILEECGVSAIILKSIYEEQIIMSNQNVLNERHEIYTDYEIESHITKDHLSEYLNFIKDCKSKTSIPIFASVNCHTYRDWIYSLEKIEKAGADGVELHITTSENLIETHRIIQKAKTLIKIPVIVKCNKVFENYILSNENNNAHVNGLILNKNFYSDFLLREMIHVNKDSHSNFNNKTNNEFPDIAISQNLKSDKDIITYLLYGAKAVTVNSLIYKMGPDYIPHLIKTLTDWMQDNNYQSISEFNGLKKMNKTNHFSI